MKNILRNRFLKDKVRLWPIILTGAIVLLFGCQTREAPLSPGAAAFKGEVKGCLDNMATNLMEPVAQKDRAGITAALEKVESPAVKLCRICPFEMGVLDPSGETLAQYPIKEDGKTKNFANYELVKKAINSKKVFQQQFFLQGGSKLYLVCAPLVREQTLIGLIVIAITSEDAKKRWDLTESEFMALDFNK
jgi:hypothetical protein